MARNTALLLKAIAAATTFISARIVVRQIDN